MADTPGIADDDGTVNIVLPATTDCAGDGAICTSDGRLLSGRLELTVSGPGGNFGPGSAGLAQEAIHHHVQLLTDTRHLALGDTLTPQGLDQVIHPPCGYPFHVGLLNDRQQRSRSSLWGTTLHPAQHQVLDGVEAYGAEPEGITHSLMQLGEIAG